MFCQAGKLHEAAYNRAYSAAADFFADRVIPFFQRFLANDPQDIVRNHGQFKDKFVAFKFAGRQPFHIHVRFNPAMVLPAFPMGMVQADYGLIKQREVCLKRV